ncbi:hypothetical protein BGZ96_009082, partial [Linnemannia gamsii]
SQGVDSGLGLLTDSDDQLAAPHIPRAFSSNLPYDRRTRDRVTQLDVFRSHRYPHSSILNCGFQKPTVPHIVPYDLIFMDIWMPKVNGLDASSYIRKNLSGNTPNRPYTMAMTSCVMPGDREKCIASGMNDYISKPLRKEELDQCLWSFTTLYLKHCQSRST